MEKNYFKKELVYTYITWIKKIFHYPRLDTVLMVEEFIKEHSGEFTKKDDVSNILCYI